MALKETIKSFTVIKSGKKYSAEDAPREAKEATVEIEVSENGKVLGTYETTGFAEGGDISYVRPAHVGSLVTPEPETQEEKPVNTGETEEK